MSAEDLKSSSGSSNSMNWKRYLIISAIILLLTSCLGALAGAAYLWADQAGYIPGWRNLGKPPEAGVEIVTGDLEDVFIRTESGEIYGCMHAGLQSDQDCWIIVNETPGIDPEVEFDNPLVKGGIKPPRGEVLDELAATIWYADAAFETRYVLLDDGAVWKKESTRTAYLSFAVCMIAPVAGAAIGFVIVLVMWGMLSLSRLKSRKN